METGVKLRAIHCFHIGNRAETRGKQTLAVDWLREALRLGSTDGTVDIPTVRTALMDSFQQVLNYEENLPCLFSAQVTEKMVANSSAQLGAGTGGTEQLQFVHPAPYVREI